MFTLYLIIVFSIFVSEESSPLESEDEDVGVTESQDDSENVSQRRSSPLAESTSNDRTKADLVSMYHQFFQEMNWSKVRCNFRVIWCQDILHWAPTVY